MPKVKATPNTKDETARQKFVRLAEKRTDNALRYMSMIASLAVPTYEYDDDDVNRILVALEDGLQKVRDRFDGKTPSASGFTLGKKD